MVYQEAPIPLETVAGGFDEALDAVLNKQPDIIIEGGTNNNPVLVRDIQKKYAGPYVGMDLDPERYYHPTWFTVYGNCLRPEHVQPIAEKHGAHRIALLTHNALIAILSDELIPGDHKDPDDRINLSTAVANITDIYALQMHVGLGHFFRSLIPFYRECVKQGWIIKEYGTDKQLMVITKNIS